MSELPEEDGTVEKYLFRRFDCLVEIDHRFVIQFIQDGDLPLQIPLAMSFNQLVFLIDLDSIDVPGFLLRPQLDCRIGTRSQLFVQLIALEIMLLCLLVLRGKYILLLLSNHRIT